MSLSVQLSLSLFIVGPSINLHLKGIALQPPRRCPFSYDYCFLSYHYYAPQTGSIQILSSPILCTCLSALRSLALEFI